MSPAEPTPTAATGSPVPADPASSFARSRRAAEPGSAWAIGTELNLVRRLARTHPELQVHYLDSTVCFCSTMNRIDLPHLVWALESLVDGRVVNPIRVDATVAAAVARTAGEGGKTCVTCFLGTRSVSATLLGVDAGAPDLPETCGGIGRVAVYPVASTTVTRSAGVRFVG